MPGGRRFTGEPSLQSLLLPPLKLCQLAKDLIYEAFGPMDPERIQESIPAEECAKFLPSSSPSLFTTRKPKNMLSEMLRESGCDLEKTYFDVPRMRTAFPGDYLKSGVAYAFHPHRDTWYSAPFFQINWWMPIFDLNSETAWHSIHITSQSRSRTARATYNYHKWNLESRHNAAQHVKADTRVQPRPEEPVELEPASSPDQQRGAGVSRSLRRNFIPRFRIHRMSRDTASISAPCTSMTSWGGLARRMWTRLHRHDDWGLPAR